MGIFFTSHQPVVPEIKSAITKALQVDPKSVTNIEQEANQRTDSVLHVTSMQFNFVRFLAALVIAAILLWAAIWTGQHNLPDVSKELMYSFGAYSGIVLGLLGGEAQKSTSR